MQDVAPAVAKLERAPVNVRAEQTPQLALPAFKVKVPPAQKVQAFAALLTSPPGAELPAAHWVPEKGECQKYALLLW